MSKSSKGSAFERDMSKKLSKWINGTGDPLLFWRQISSGGLLQRSMFQDGKNLAGDIHSIHPDGNFLTDIFSIELKNGYKGTRFDKHLLGLKSDEIKLFWDQCLRDARTVEKLPLLIFKKHNCGVFLAMDQLTYDKLKDVLIESRTLTLSWPSTENDYPPAVFVMEKDFFENVTPNIVKERLGK